jgi:hypothetical protein
MESPSPSPLRGKGFTQLEMIEFAESLLEYLPINTMEWERLQREKHETRSVSTLKQKWKSMLSRRKSFDAGTGNIMNLPLELTHVTKILQDMKRKKSIVKERIDLMTHSYYTWKRWCISVFQSKITNGVGLPNKWNIHFNKILEK